MIPSRNLNIVPSRNLNIFMPLTYNTYRLQCVQRTINDKLSVTFTHLKYFQIKGEKPNCLSQYKQYFLGACRINFGMKRSAEWWGNNSEVIHDSFSEFEYCHAVNLRRTSSFQRTINNKLSVTLLA